MSVKFKFSSINDTLSERNKYLFFKLNSPIFEEIVIKLFFVSIIAFGLIKFRTLIFDWFSVINLAETENFCPFWEKPEYLAPSMFKDGMLLLSFKSIRIFFVENFACHQKKTKNYHKK